MNEITHREWSSKGGKQRAKNLTKDQLIEIARKGGKAKKGYRKTWKHVNS